MEFPLTEPTTPRYLYINPLTNQVHVLMPIVSGTWRVRGTLIWRPLAT